VAAIVAEAVGTRPTVDVVNALVSVPVFDGTSMPVVVRRLDEAGIAVTELALRLPSLDEVFLALTGHATEEQDTAVLEGVGR
jgi:oleandomycin transport system ATP-binding protein